MIGSILAKDFAGSMKDAAVVIVDKNEERAKKTALNIRDATWISIDSTDYTRLVEILREFDLVLGALPGDYGFLTMRAAIEAGVDMVDVSFTPENPLELDEAAKKTEITIIPDCGVAPGLTNMMVGYAASKLDNVIEAMIMCGGIPEYPVPPLGYTITWSAEGLIDEYVRDVRIIEGGRVAVVPALSGLEEIEFPGVGRLEAFYTDGLRTLLQTFSNVETMWEKTMRYPGHVESVKLLRALGLFDNGPINVGDSQISPRLMTARLLEKSLKKPDVGDILTMKVEVAGRKGRKDKRYTYYLLDKYDFKTRVTAMARTTAYTASIVAQKLANGEIKGSGVIPPEKLGMNQKLFESIILELKEKGVKVEEHQTKARARDRQ
jgi:saccharopine dehydrogenase-like NADP-dependent oxidoreductase